MPTLSLLEWRDPTSIITHFERTTTPTTPLSPCRDFINQDLQRPTALAVLFCSALPVEQPWERMQQVLVVISRTFFRGRLLFSSSPLEGSQALQSSIGVRTFMKSPAQSVKTTPTANITGTPPERGHIFPRAKLECELRGLRGVLKISSPSTIASTILGIRFPFGVRLEEP